MVRSTSCRRPFAPTKSAPAKLAVVRGLCSTDSIVAFGCTCLKTLSCRKGKPVPCHAIPVELLQYLLLLRKLLWQSLRLEVANRTRRMLCSSTFLRVYHPHRFCHPSEHLHRVPSLSTPHQQLPKKQTAPVFIVRCRCLQVACNSCLDTWSTR